MALSNEIKQEICNILFNVVREKLSKYKPETLHMPFHFRLLGRDRYAMFSFVHSMNTTFGMSIWEQISEVLAKGAGFKAKRQFRLNGEIDNETENLIKDIHYNLRKGTSSVDKENETEKIKNSIIKGEAKIDPDSVVDLFICFDNNEHYFDITSAKPNMKEFVALKLKLLRWVGLRLSQEKSINIFTRLAIPYNPYHPEEYDRWTLKGLYDLSEEIKSKEVLVGDEFWNFLANDNIYEELLDVFQEVGTELRDEIDEKFAELQK